MDAAATHLREHIAMRAKEERGLSSTTRAQVERLLAMRTVLDGIEALVTETPPATAVEGRRDLVLIAAMEAAERGYVFDT